jgi:hypothetical protein
LRLKPAIEACEFFEAFKAFKAYIARSLWSVRVPGNGSANHAKEIFEAR